ncbi:ABC transporter ATP-binding protein [Clostridium sp.]|uniref:ABC transporter ATP-binding protein n=1 Tax=Clostridium sp. TaxID=1506 RepID=UPI003D6CF169
MSEVKEGLNTVLKIEDVKMQFGGVTAVKDFNLTLNKGEIVALIGPNGAGKTTVFNMVTGVYKPTEGKINFNNRDITGMRPDLITKTGIARTFQNIRLFKDLTVLDNVLIANHLNIKSNFMEAIGRLPKYKREEKTMMEKSLNLLEKVGLLDQKDDKAHSLPYGKQRRLEIARAMATSPEVLLLDEPAAGMNPKETEDLTRFIKQIRDEFNLTIFMIEHHMQVVMGISDRIYVLDYGVTIAEGTPYDIQNNERVIQAYLGVSEDDA